MKLRSRQQVPWTLAQEHTVTPVGCQSPVARWRCSSKWPSQQAGGGGLGFASSGLCQALELAGVAEGTRLVMGAPEARGTGLSLLPTCQPSFPCMVGACSQRGSGKQSSTPEICTGVFLFLPRLPAQCALLRCRQLTDVSTGLPIFNCERRSSLTKVSLSGRLGPGSPSVTQQEQGG